MVQIREATSHDVTAIIDFQLKMALETENVQLEISTLSQGVHRLIKDRSKGKYYVAETEGEVVGCLSITYEWSDWRCGTVIWIQSVYVSEPWRGKGVYKAMYEYIRSFVASDPELIGIRLYVDNTNARAKKVYSSLGMDGNHYSVFEWMKQ
jgi:N-acetylglutamate synthase-like GNAT family acetyltransferase